MRPYKDFRPTALDPKGLAILDERREWLVCPVSQTRDSGCLERSNFRVVAKDLDAIDPEDKDHESHKFRHWGPGWFQIIIVRPGTKAAEAAEAWEAALADCPVACDSDFSDLEYEEACHYWEHYPRGDRGRLDYLHDHRRDFNLANWLELMANVRGAVFSGSPRDLLGE